MVSQVYHSEASHPRPQVYNNDDTDTDALWDVDTPHRTAYNEGHMVDRLYALSAFLSEAPEDNTWNSYNAVSVWAICDCSTAPRVRAKN